MIQKPPAALIRKPPTALLWGLVAAGIAGALSPLEPSLLEEGMLVHVAQRLAHGERLYSDVVFFTGPLPFELLAALFRLFGEEIGIARGIVVVLQGLGTASIFSLARGAGAGPFAHGVAAALAFAPAFLFPLLSLYFYTTLAFSLSVLAAHATALGSRSSRWACGAGVLLGCIALCKQNLGLLVSFTLFAALLASAGRDRTRRALFMGAGGAGVAAFTLLAYALRGGLGDLVHSMVVLPLTLGQGFSVAFPSLWPVGSFDAETLSSAQMYVPNVFWLLGGELPQMTFPVVSGTQMLFVLPFLAGGAGILVLVRRGNEPCATAHAALLFAWMSNLYPRPDWGHLAYVLPLAVGQLLILVGRRTGGFANSWPGRRVSTALVLLFAAPGTFLILKLYAVSDSPVLGPRVPQRPVASVYRSPPLRRVVEYLRRHAEPGENLFVARQEPLLYFATGLRNPTAFEGVMPGLPGQEENILAALPEVRFVVLSDLDQPGYTYYAQELPRVQEAFERYYAIPDRYPLDISTWIHVAERRGDRGDSRIDLVEQQATARRWLRLGTQVRTPESQLTDVAARLILRPLVMQMDEDGGGLDFDVEIPADARFVSGVGLRMISTPSGYLKHSPRVDLRVSVDAGTGFEILHEEKVRITRSSGWRWQPLSVDLSAYAGERVTLRLEGVPLPPRYTSYAWWGSPRITVGGEP